MNLHGIVSVSGKPGLWKALAQNKTGFILESLDEKKIKLVANLTTAKLAALDEITIFGTDEDLKLKDVFEQMKSASSVPDIKDANKLRPFFREVAPDHDEEKVYASDMKKIIGWYNHLKDMPLFNEEPVAIAEGQSVAEEVVETPAPEVPVEIEKPKNKVVKKKKTE